MRVRMWQFVFAAFLASIMSFGLVGCSSQEQQQGEDLMEGQEGDEEQGQYDEQGQEDGQQYEDQQYSNEEGDESEGDEEGYDEEGSQSAQQQDELQDIIEGMNEGEGEGEGYSNNAGNNYAMENQGEGENAGAIEEAPLPVEEAPQNIAAADTTDYQSQASAGLPAAPGVPELGSKMPYVVSRGDTLASIASKVYGDREKWREIADFTGMANPNRIYPGDVIYYQLTDQTMAFASAYESVPRSEITVEPGDTLSTISARVFGNSQDWKMVWRQNDNIDNPDVLVVGQTLYYVEPGALTAAVDKFRSSVAKTSNQVKETIVSTVEAISSSVRDELDYDVVALRNASLIDFI